MKYLPIIGVLFLFTHTVTVQSENKCEEGFFSGTPPPIEDVAENTAHKSNTEYNKKFHFKNNPISPRRVKRIATKHYQDKVSKVEIDYLELISDITQTENMRLLTGTINGQKVLIEEITPMNLQKLAVLRTLKEIGIPTLFLGTGKNSKNTPYLIYDFIEGEDVPLMLVMPQQWEVNMTSSYTSKQIEDIGKFFILKGIYTDSLEVFISKDGSIFINHPQNYIFKGRQLKRHLKEEIEIYFRKIIKNIEKNSHHAEESFSELFNSKQPPKDLSLEEEPPTLEKPPNLENSPLPPEDIAKLKEIFGAVITHQIPLSLSQKVQLVRILQLESTVTDLLKSPKQAAPVLVQKKPPQTPSPVIPLHPPQKKTAVSY